MKYTEEQKTKMIEDLWSNSHKKLIHFMYRYNMSPEEREDVIQEAFLKAFKSLDSYRGASKLETWLFQIAKNIWLNKIRYNHFKKRDYKEFDKVSYENTFKHKVVSTGVTDPILQAELADIIDRVITFKFKERPQFINVMREIFINHTDMSHDELAEAYGVNAQSIRREKFKIGQRILEKLRALKAI